MDSKTASCFHTLFIIVYMACSQTLYRSICICTCQNFIYRSTSVLFCGTRIV